MTVRMVLLPHGWGRNGDKVTWVRLLALSSDDHRVNSPSEGSDKASGQPGGSGSAQGSSTEYRFLTGCLV